MSNMSSPLTILGLGGAGCRIIRELNALPVASQLRLLAVDTDAESIAESGLPPEAVLQASREWRIGKGCGGDELVGQRSIAKERHNLEKMLEGSRILVITGGLGGGVCTGGAPVVLGAAAKLQITTVAFLSLPFSMEGFRRRRIADEAIAKELLPRADAVITLPNDLLFASLPGETPMLQAYRMADKEMADAITALTVVLTAGNLFSADAGSLCSLFYRKGGSCAIGAGCADTAAGEGVETAMERALLSPLLGNAAAGFAEADGVIFTVTGGENLTMAEARRALELANAQLPPEPERKILMGAAVLPEMGSRIQITVLTVHYSHGSDDESSSSFEASNFPESNDAPAVPLPRRRKSNVQAGNSDQLQLPNFDTEEKGIMENTAQVMFEGEDLDVPTFKRRNIVLE